MSSSTIVQFKSFVESGVKNWRQTVFTIAIPAAVWTMYAVASIMMDSLTQSSANLAQELSLIPTVMFWVAICSSVIGIVRASMQSVLPAASATVLFILFGVLGNGIAAMICIGVALSAMLVHGFTFTIYGSQQTGL